MNIPEANAALARPLRMGDPEQIAAKRFLEDVAACHTALLRCRMCRGDGLVRWRLAGLVQCHCVVRFAREVIEACGIDWIGPRFQ
jgi:hypothetical protein